jgi:MoaA/NifB/PqqE/SkfB family radical SAM enzyme
MGKIYRYATALRDVLQKPLVAHQPPIHIQLEFTTFCNLNCKPCLRAKHMRNAPAHLSPEEFRHIVEPIRPIKISMSGRGEPFMSPHLFDLIRMAKGFGSTINTTTNCTLMTPERATELVKSGLDLLKISIDAATPGTYREIRGEDRFQQVVDGARTLVETRKRMGANTPYIRFNYVVSRDNYTELAQTVELAEQLRIDAIYFQPLGLYGNEEMQEELVGDMTRTLLEQEIHRALEVDARTHVSTNLRTFLKQLPLHWNRYQLQAQQHARMCLLPWFSAYVTLEGSMRPCCTCLHEYTNMGNLLDSPLDEVWNGGKFQQFRKAIRGGARPFPVCETCIPQTLTDIANYSKILPGFLK